MATRTTEIKYKQIGQNLNCFIGKETITVKIIDKDEREKLKSEINKYNLLKDHKTPVAVKQLAGIMRKIQPVKEAKKKEVEDRKTNLKVEKKVVKNKIKNESNIKGTTVKLRSLDDITKENVSPEEIAKMKEILAREQAKEQPVEQKTTTTRGRESYR